MAAIDVSQTASQPKHSAGRLRIFDSRACPHAGATPSRLSSGPPRTPYRGCSARSAPPAGAAPPSSAATGSATAGRAAPPPPASARPRICILGGGFGGLYTAIKLEGLVWGRSGVGAAGRPAITLVDQAPRFVFKPLLYELLSADAGEDDVAPEYAALLADSSVRAPRCP
jgi:hypothetical protein